MQAQKQRDPLVGGILASFKASTGDGLLSRTTTMRAADTGLLGRVGSIQDENVLGSLAATMTKPQQDQMLTVDRDRQVLNMAQAKGDVSPKEFTGWVQAGMKKAQRAGQLLQALGQAADFPALSSFPEGRYLKVQVWRIL